MGKETKTKEKDEVWMKQLADAQRTRAQESACGRERERERERERGDEIASAFLDEIGEDCGDGWVTRNEGKYELGLEENRERNTTRFGGRSKEGTKKRTNARFRGLVVFAARGRGGAALLSHIDADDDDDGRRRRRQYGWKKLRRASCSCG